MCVFSFGLGVLGMARLKGSWFVSSMRYGHGMKEDKDNRQKYGVHKDGRNDCLKATRVTGL
jgi:hypothetical protein